MIKIPIGISFSDGDEWESFCQSCLKIKHQSHHYNSVPADDGGDYGLDGFNSLGDVYQCYCPEKEYTDKELYEHQRNKITEDSKKLNTYQDKIKKMLNGIKIKTWHFTTPLVKSKDLILHCNKIENDIKKLGLDFIDKDFKITIKDYEYFRPEIPFVIESDKFLKSNIANELDFESKEVDNDIIKDYKEKFENNEFVNNGLRKNAKLFPIVDGKDYSKNIVQLTDTQIGEFLIGEDIIEKLSSYNDRLYEKFVRVRKTLGNKIKKESLIPVSDNSSKLADVEITVKALIDKEFNMMSESNRLEITSYLVSYWILECSLDFS